MKKKKSTHNALQQFIDITQIDREQAYPLLYGHSETVENIFIYQHTAGTETPEILRMLEKQYKTSRAEDGYTQVMLGAISAQAKETRNDPSLCPYIFAAYINLTRQAIPSYTHSLFYRAFTQFMHDIFSGAEDIFSIFSIYLPVYYSIKKKFYERTVVHVTYGELIKSFANCYSCRLIDVYRLFCTLSRTNDIAKLCRFARTRPAIKPASNKSIAEFITTAEITKSVLFDLYMALDKKKNISTLLGISQKCRIDQRLTHLDISTLLKDKTSETKDRSAHYTDAANALKYYTGATSDLFQIYVNFSANAFYEALHPETIRVFRNFYFDMYGYQTDTAHQYGVFSDVYPFLLRHEYGGRTVACGKKTILRAFVKYWPEKIRDAYALFRKDKV